MQMNSGISPLLRTLAIRFLDNHREDSELFSIQIFRDSPLLHEVSLSRVPPSFIPLPWDQLSKFTGELYSIADCLEALRLIPNLTECHFAALYNLNQGSSIEFVRSIHETDVSAEHETLPHPKLLSLTLFRATTQAQSLEILDFILLPALQTLQLLHIEADKGVLDRFLSQCSPPLRKFTHRPTHFSDRLDHTSLSLMPQLVDLEIWGPDLWWANDFLNHFDGQDIAFLPSCLQHLALLGCEKAAPPSDMLHTLQEGLVARWQARDRAGFATLKSFRLVWTNDSENIPPEALLPFQKLAAEGMDVCIQAGTISYI
jgi:hypothetical protein